jgi:hypothetical protein
VRIKERGPAFAGTTALRGNECVGGVLLAVDEGQSRRSVTAACLHAWIANPIASRPCSAAFPQANPLESLSKVNTSRPSPPYPRSRSNVRPSGDRVSGSGREVAQVTRSHEGRAQRGGSGPSTRDRVLISRPPGLGDPHPHRKCRKRSQEVLCNQQNIRKEAKNEADRSHPNPCSVRIRLVRKKSDNLFGMLGLLQHPHRAATGGASNVIHTATRLWGPLGWRGVREGSRPRA